MGVPAWHCACALHRSVVVCCLTVCPSEHSRAMRLAQPRISRCGRPLSTLRLCHVSALTSSIVERLAEQGVSGWVGRRGNQRRSE